MMRGFAEIRWALEELRVSLFVPGSDAARLWYHWRDYRPLAELGL